MFRPFCWPFAWRAHSASASMRFFNTKTAPRRTDRIRNSEPLMKHGSNTDCFPCFICVSSVATAGLEFDYSMLDLVGIEDAQSDGPCQDDMVRLAAVELFQDLLGASLRS